MTLRPTSIRIMDPRLQPPQPLQPGLAQSVTEEDEDEDDEGQHDLHNALVEEVRATGGGDRKALAYLLRYETMVRQQEAEEMATLAHIRPLIERIQELSETTTTTAGQRNALPELVHTGNNVGDANDDYATLAKEISYRQLKRALEALKSENTTDVMTTDRQLMMILRVLTQKTTNETDETISWGELVQMYKICILGMFTLQHMPAGTLSRSRARERTLAMLSLFEPPSTKLFNEGVALDIEALHALNRGMPRDVEVPKPPARLSNKQLLAVLAGALVIGTSYTVWLPKENAYHKKAVKVFGGLNDVARTVAASFGPEVSKRELTSKSLPPSNKRDLPTSKVSSREISTPKVSHQQREIPITETPVPEPSPLIDFFAPASHSTQEYPTSHSSTPHPEPSPPTSRFHQAIQLHPSSRPIPLKNLSPARLDEELPRTTIVHVQGVEAHPLPAALGIVVGAVSVAAVPSVMAAVQVMLTTLPTLTAIGVMSLWAVTTLVVVSTASKSLQWLWARLTRRNRNQTR